MNIEQIYTGCLAQGAYYIESNGEVAIIDPLRETEHYLARAKHDNAEIKFIFETHFHADFVSGHITLAAKSGATIVYGPTAKTGYKSHIAEDGEVFQLGDITITALHTPGHTMESTTYLLKDKDGKDHAIFSGDTLFLGDVGRPDLAQKVATMTQEELAGILFDSLRTKIMPLADDVTVYPAHGAGSACGKNMMKETVDTLGNQKRMNYALREDMTREEFIQEVTEGILPPPAYFPENVTLNKLGYNPENDSIDKANIALSVEEFKTKSTQAGVIILDVRSAADFVKGFIPNSIFIGIDGGFAPWVGTIIKQVATPILLVCDKGRLEEVATRLSRVGFDNVLGHLNGGVQVWEQDDLATISSISANAFDEIYQADNVIDIIDVRKEAEYKNRHIISAVFNPLSDLENDKLNSTAENFVHCAGGYRSVIACSLLKREGIHNVTNIEGGFGAIKKTDLPLSEEVCPSTL